MNKLLQQSHSLRNFSPEQVLDVAQENKEHAREFFNYVESGRFEPVLESNYKMFVALDRDERDQWAGQNQELLDWTAVWAFSEDLNAFEEFSTLEFQR